MGYSFKNIGWNEFYLKLDTEFYVSIKSNFGYGRSSYFLITLIYRGVQSIPYSIYIKYRFADTSEIIRHTREIALFDYCWPDALNFIKDAYNLCLKNPDEFVDKYYINECKTMVDGLEFLFNSNSIKKYANLVKMHERQPDVFSIKQDKLYVFNESEEDFIIYKLEKISGALDFCE